MSDRSSSSSSVPASSQPPSTPTSPPLSDSSGSSTIDNGSSSSSTTPVDPPLTGPAPTFSNGDSASKPPIEVNGLAVSSIVLISIAAVFVAGIIGTVFFIWIRRRRRVQNARFEGDEERKSGGQGKHLNNRSHSTLVMNEPIVVHHQTVPAAQSPKSSSQTNRDVLVQKQLFTLEDVSNTAIIFNQNDYMMDTVIDSNTISTTKKPMVLERKSGSGSATPTDEFHATRVRHSVQDVNFDPELLLEATGRRSKRSTVMLDLEAYNGSTSNLGDTLDVKSQRRLSRPLSVPLSPAHEIQDNLYNNNVALTVEEIIPAGDTPLDVSEITKRQPTLPDLTVIAGDIPNFAPGYPYANTPERNSSASSAFTSPQQSNVSLPYGRQPNVHTSRPNAGSARESPTITPRSPVLVADQAPLTSSLNETAPSSSNISNSAVTSLNSKSDATLALHSELGDKIATSQPAAVSDTSLKHSITSNEEIQGPNEVMAASVMDEVKQEPANVSSNDDNANQTTLEADSAKDNDDRKNSGRLSSSPAQDRYAVKQPYDARRRRAHINYLVIAVL
ncbi:hypothetical protein BDF19DRAFT_462047 [Syncephalis fuscata]|nr:hypothetical protein BDF19DRAFT_462047 [Syncephalis fuscata]